MSVFGFNTDIRYGDTVYHVQTEAHESERSLQTAIFVRGRCINKVNSSYAQESAAPGFSEQQVHQLLTNQHKLVVNCIREGKLEAVLNMTSQTSVSPVRRDYIPPVLENYSEATQQELARSDDEGDVLGVEPAFSPTEAVAAASVRTPETISASKEETEIRELKLEWLAADSVFSGNSVSLRYRLTAGSSGVEGAKIVARLEVGGVPSAYARAVSDCEGEAEVSFKVPSSAKADSLSITVQASHAGKSAARRFRLSRS